MKELLKKVDRVPLSTLPPHIFVFLSHLFNLKKSAVHVPAILNSLSALFPFRVALQNATR